MGIMAEENIFFPVSEAAQPLFVGMNFGGAYLKIGVIDNEGRTVSFFATPHHGERGPDEATKHVAFALKEALEKTGTTLSPLRLPDIVFPAHLIQRRNRCTVRRISPIGAVIQLLPS